MQTEQISDQIDRLVKEGWRLFESWKLAVKTIAPIEMIEYERWYSDTVPLIELLLPHRIDDFKRLYRSEGGYNWQRQTYGISDFLNAVYLPVPIESNLSEEDEQVYRFKESGKAAAVLLKLQVGILTATNARLERLA